MNLPTSTQTAIDAALTELREHRAKIDRAISDLEALGALAPRKPAPIKSLPAPREAETEAARLDKRRPTGAAAATVAVIRPGEVLSLEEVAQRLPKRSRSEVQNALHDLGRKGVLFHPERGKWSLSPAAPSEVA